jgi:hypothetical protein
VAVIEMDGSEQYYDPAQTMSKQSFIAYKADFG